MSPKHSSSSSPLFRFGVHWGHGGCAEVTGPAASGSPGARSPATPRRPPACRTTPPHPAPPQADRWQGSHHLLQHQDPWRSAYAQTLSGDAGGHDGLTLENRWQMDEGWRKGQKKTCPKFLCVQGLQKPKENTFFGLNMKKTLCSCPPVPVFHIQSSSFIWFQWVPRQHRLGSVQTHFIFLYVSVRWTTDRRVIHSVTSRPSW